MRVTMTGAAGLVGSALVSELKRRGAEVSVLSRSPERAEAKLGVRALHWEPMSSPAPAAALDGADAVVHLAGEPIAQRWTKEAKRLIYESRQLGTRNLVSGMRDLAAPPATLVCSSGVDIYGAHYDEPLDEEAPAGSGFLAETCIAWEAEANAARELGVRVVTMRTGLVLASEGGALAKMLPPFRMGVGGPIAGGRQFVSWIHLDDLARMFATAIEDVRWHGAVNATSPAPVSNRELSRALGRVLHRPAVMPVPATALKLLYGEMSEVITTGRRALPAKALVLGFEFEHENVTEALAAVLA